MKTKAGREAFKGVMGGREDHIRGKFLAFREKVANVAQGYLKMDRAFALDVAQQWAKERAHHYEQGASFLDSSGILLNLATVLAAVSPQWGKWWLEDADFVWEVVDHSVHPKTGAKAMTLYHQIPNALRSDPRIFERCSHLAKTDPYVLATQQAAAAKSSKQGTAGKVVSGTRGRRWG